MGCGFPALDVLCFIFAADDYSCMSGALHIRVNPDPPHGGY